MGLDCTAYSNIKVLPDMPAGEERDENTEYEEWIGVFAYLGFDRSTRGLADHDKASYGRWGGDTQYLAVHEYDISESATFGWRAGSYMGYGRFRSSLSELVGYVTDAQFYLDPGAYADRPFFELVWFADNEGCIGHEAAADLLQDFIDHRDAYLAKHTEDGSWFASSYDEWIKGLTLAADRGMVRFH